MNFHKKLEFDLEILSIYGLNYLILYTICQFSALPLAIDGPVKIVSTFVGHHCVKCTVSAVRQDSNYIVIVSTKI